MKNIKWFSGFLMLIVCSCSTVSRSQDIALHKSYTYSTPPNYNLTSDDADHTLLTDGVFTTGYFWTSKTTVGWTGRRRVGIQIDLGQPSVINGVAVNSARGNAGVNFPSNIFVFTSLDGVNYNYVGDAGIDPDNIPGPYEIKKFALTGINRTARYVKLELIANGAFIFCDEIEVSGGNHPSNTSSRVTAAITNVETAVDSLLKSKNDSKKMRYEIARLKASTDQSNATIDKPVDLDATISDNSLPAALNQAKSARASQLRAKFHSTFVIDKVNPWDNISFPYQPKGNNDNSYNIITPVNGVQFGAFTITNLSATNEVFDVISQGTVSNTAVTEVYQSPFVITGNNYEEIADPLLTNTRGINLPPGESKMFLFKVTGKGPGQMKTSIIIQSSSYKSQISVNIQVANTTFPAAFSLNFDSWAYLTYPLISDRKDEAVSDLLKHHINTMIVPPAVLPTIGSADYKGFKDYKNYISNLKSFTNIFLFMDFKNALYKQQFKKTPFMSPEWKDAFNKWYDGIIQASTEAGLSPAHIYLYAYDEVGKEDIPDFYNFLTWLRTARPEARTFGTQVNPESINKIMPLLTIAQVAMINNNVQLVSGSSNPNKIWLYDVKDHAESLSPYNYYRLMAWTAFYNDFNGVGVWNYADYENGTTNKTTVDNFDGVSAINYSLIYDGPGKEIISSRRWEAYSLGIEDVELLRMYAQKFGLSNAKQLAQTVVNNPNDLTKADAVRNQILEALSK